MKKFIAAAVLCCVLSLTIVSCSSNVENGKLSSSKISSSSSLLQSSASVSSQTESSTNYQNQNNSGENSSSKAASSVPQKVYVNITIPPGFCVVQIANKLEENKVCSKKDFLDKINSYPFTESSIKQIPDSPKFICYRLEGYLYPDTYQFYQNMKAEDAIGIMLKGADKHIGGNYSYSGMSAFQVVTLASIIEKEAPDRATMKKVSSVFHNRLNNSAQYPYLQSEATRKYLTSYISSVSSSLVEKYKNYYNTNRVSGSERRKGLPAGPICSPGANALYAAAHPDDTDYYYFRSDKDGNYSFSHDLNGDAK